MSDYLPKEIRDQLAAAQRIGRRNGTTRAVHTADEAFAILSMSHDGFTVDAATTPRLRGLVDIYEGARHLYQALVVAAERDGGVMRYDFKRITPALNAAPVDFECIETPVIALLTRD